jgi:hypothetical protein
LAMATPDEVLRGAAQIARVAGLASEIEAAATEAIAQVDGVAAGASERLAELDSQLASVVATAGQVVADCRAMVESNNAAMVAKTTAAISKRIAGLEVQAAQLRGPKGNTGNPGTCTTVGAGRPEGPGALEPLIGRGAIQGDVYIDGADDNRRAYRWTGQVWEPGPAMATVQVRDVKVSALDASVKTFPTVSTAAGGGSGGSLAADPVFLPASTVQPNASILIGDSSRWQAGGSPEFRSGMVALQIVPADGPFGGGTNFIEAAFVVVAGGGDPFRFSEGFALGRAIDAGDLKVDLSGQIGPATVPGSLGVTLPAGTANACRIWITIKAPTPPTGASRYFVTGRIEWSPAAATGAAPANSLLVKSPAWALI